jgi:hypothetical protein
MNRITWKKTFINDFEFHRNLFPFLNKKYQQTIVSNTNTGWIKRTWSWHTCIKTKALGKLTRYENYFKRNTVEMCDNTWTAEQLLPPTPLATSGMFTSDWLAGLPDDSFQTKNPNLGKFWRVLDLKMLIYILYGHLEYFVLVWYIFPV